MLNKSLCKADLLIYIDTHTCTCNLPVCPPQPSIRSASPPSQGTLSNRFTSFEFRSGRKTPRRVDEAWTIAETRVLGPPFYALHDVYVHCVCLCENCDPCMHTHTHARTHAHIHTHTYTHARTHTHTCTHARTHTHIHNILVTDISKL